MPSFYQDRLGTNIGKALKKRDVFSCRFATFCGLAGVSPIDKAAERAGLPPVDRYEASHKPVTSQSQVSHKSVTSQSQVSHKSVTSRNAQAPLLFFCATVVPIRSLP